MFIFSLLTKVFKTKLQKKIEFSRYLLKFDQNEESKWKSKHPNYF